MLVDRNSIDTGLALMLADILLRYKRVSYRPDVEECERAIRGMPGLQRALIGFSTRNRQIVNERTEQQLRRRRQRSNDGELDDEHEYTSWSEVKLAFRVLGDYLALAPLWNVYHLPTLRDHESSRAELDQRTHKVAFRLFRNGIASSDVHLCAIARALSLDVAVVVGHLHDTQEISWRALGEVSGSEDGARAAHFFAYGTADSTDIRLVGSGDGLVEGVISSATYDAARRVVALLVEALSNGSPELPPNGITGVVLRESTAQENTRQ